MSSAKLALVLRDIAGVVGGILVPRVLRSRRAKRAAKPQEIFASGEAARENPTLLAAPPPKQYSTLTLIPPATLATWDMALLRTMILPKILFSRVYNSKPS